VAHFIEYYGGHKKKNEKSLLVLIQKDCQDPINAKEKKNKKKTSSFYSMLLSEKGGLKYLYLFA
jgi:hypothetical protein